MIGTHAGTPEVLHWGSGLEGKLGDAELASVFSDVIAHNDSDIVPPFGIWRENGRGHVGRPTFLAHRDGVDFSPLFELQSGENAGNALTLKSVDAHAELP